jgi:hypothetical protein
MAQHEPMSEPAPPAKDQVYFIPDTSIFVVFTAEPLPVPSAEEASKARLIAVHTSDTRHQPTYTLRETH